MQTYGDLGVTMHWMTVPCLVQVVLPEDSARQRFD